MRARGLTSAIREGIALALIDFGNFIRCDESGDGHSLAPKQQNVKGGLNVRSHLQVVLSRHAVQRYGERGSRRSGRQENSDELKRIWTRVALSASAPEWFKDDPERNCGMMYGEYKSLLFLLQPHAELKNCLIVVTVVRKPYKLILAEKSAAARASLGGEHR